MATFKAGDSVRVADRGAETAYTPCKGLSGTVARVLSGVPDPFPNVVVAFGAGAEMVYKAGELEELGCVY